MTDHVTTTLASLIQSTSAPTASPTAELSTRSLTQEAKVRSNHRPMIQEPAVILSIVWAGVVGVVLYMYIFQTIYSHYQIKARDNPEDRWAKSWYQIYFWTGLLPVSPILLIIWPFWAAVIKIKNHYNLPPLVPEPQIPNHNINANGNNNNNNNNNIQLKTIKKPEKVVTASRKIVTRNNIDAYAPNYGGQHSKEFNCCDPSKSFCMIMPYSEVGNVVARNTSPGDHCCICLSNLEPNDQVIVLPCEHYHHHLDCVKEFIKSQARHGLDDLKGSYFKCMVCQLSVKQHYLYYMEKNLDPSVYRYSNRKN